MKKIVFIGPPDSGKTSVRKWFFENHPVIDIIKHNSLEPTMGVNWYNYDLNNTTIGAVDTSGQEILDILTDNMLLMGTDAVIFMFDTYKYLESYIIKAEFTQYLLELISSKIEFQESYDVFILAHKIDLIDEDLLDDIAIQIEQAFKEAVLKKFGDKQEITIYFTSLFPEPIEETRKAIEEIILQI